MYKMVCLYVMGAANASKTTTNNPMIHGILDSVIGWCGAAWAYNGLNTFHRLFAAVSVALLVCEPWEWPPLFVPLREAWSVRQIWRCVVS